MLMRPPKQLLIRPAESWRTSTGPRREQLAFVSLPTPRARAGMNYRLGASRVATDARRYAKSSMMRHDRAGLNLIRHGWYAISKNQG